MTIPIGEVISVIGIEVSLRAFESSNLETHFLNGERYKGISIREFISIGHGFREIVCIIEGEYLDEKHFVNDGSQTSYIRKLRVRPIGYFEEGSFRDGIKYLPKIGDTANLLSEGQVGQIFERDADEAFVIGKLVKEGISISLPWQRIFNSHLGIFGNTGSGKSNTLTKLYTVLFDNKIDCMAGRSKFVFIDFNGEYTGEQLASPEQKEIVRLKTRGKDGDKFGLNNDEFWDAETLGILFQATTNTQKPFLRRIINGRNKYSQNPESLKNFIRSIFRRVITSSDPSLEALGLVKHLARSIDAEEALLVSLEGIGRRKGRDVDSFHCINSDGQWQYLSQEKFYYYYIEEFGDKLNNILVDVVTAFDELQIRANLQIIQDVLTGSAQYEHIHPLLRRIEALKNDYSKVIEVGEAGDNRKVITVISLRECKQEVRKILPMLIAKHYYESHKEKVASPSPETTLHLVIDEAHNILSQQSNREAESWRDYRLELFEEIIKEGRKFGVFITLASQRPADISPTVVSQLHNYFIHRLVNDRDLSLLENTISTLDGVSRSQIPSLPQGACVVTGTTFDLPMLLQIEELSEKRRPDSSDVDLTKIWMEPNFL